MFTASATALSYAWAERPLFSTGAAALALLAYVLRRKVISKMDALRAQIQDNGARAIAEFRRMHVAAMLINLTQLTLVVWSLITLSLQLR